MQVKISESENSDLFLYLGNEPDHSQNLIWTQLKQTHLLIFFYPTSGLCVIMLTKKQIIIEPDK